MSPHEAISSICPGLFDDIAVGTCAAPSAVPARNCAVEATPLSGVLAKRNVGDWPMSRRNCCRSSQFPCPSGPALAYAGLALSWMGYPRLGSSVATAVGSN